MTAIQTAIDEPWSGDDGEICRIVVGDRVSLDTLRRVEASLGITFPDDYVTLVTKAGLYRFESRLEDDDPDPFCAMLELDQITTRVDLLRQRLIPFQAQGDATSSDVYCFVPDQVRDGRMQVIVASSEEDDLSRWFEIPDKEKIWGLDAHLARWVEEMRQAV